jgi:hypothetical protein
MSGVHGISLQTGRGAAYINRAVMLGLLMRLHIIKEMTLRRAAVKNYDIYKRAVECEYEAQITSHTSIPRGPHCESVSDNEDD